MDGMLIKSSDIACARSLQERRQIPAALSMIANFLSLSTLSLIISQLGAVMRLDAAFWVAPAFKCIGNRRLGARRMRLDGDVVRSRWVLFQKP